MQVDAFNYFGQSLGAILAKKNFLKILLSGSDE